MVDPFPSRLHSESRLLGLSCEVAFRLPSGEVSLKVVSWSLGLVVGQGVLVLLVLDVLLLQTSV